MRLHLRIQAQVPELLLIGSPNVCQHVLAWDIASRNGGPTDGLYVFLLQQLVITSNCCANCPA